MAQKNGRMLAPMQGPSLAREGDAAMRLSAHWSARQAVVLVNGQDLGNGGVEHDQQQRAERKACNPGILAFLRMHDTYLLSTAEAALMSDRYTPPLAGCMLPTAHSSLGSVPRGDQGHPFLEGMEHHVHAARHLGLFGIIAFR